MASEKIIHLKVADVAEYMGITPAAVYLILKKGKFPNSIKPESRKHGWRICLQDVDTYVKNKYSRDYMYDEEKGEISVRHAADLLELPAQIVYYFLRRGYLKYTRDSFHYVLDKTNVMTFKKDRLS